MADPVTGNVTTDVNMKGSFKGASEGSSIAAKPYISYTVKPEKIPQIVENLAALESRTDDAKIVKRGTKYAFMDMKNGQPLAELDTAAGVMTLYKSPTDLAARIDSHFISAEKIKDFINDSRAQATPPIQVAMVK